MTDTLKSRLINQYGPQQDSDFQRCIVTVIVITTITKWDIVNIGLTTYILPYISTYIHANIHACRVVHIHTSRA